MQTTTQNAFTKYQATQRLTQLAEHPYDLTKPGNLSPERLKTFSASSCGYKLLYGTERIDEGAMGTLFDLAREAKAIEKLSQMQAGAIMNEIKGFPSEHRAVLHTATRDFFENPNPAKASQEATRLARHEADKLKAFIEQIDKEQRFTDVLMIGIGGSDLGPRAHYLALQHLQKQGRQAHFICNIDPDDAALAFSHLNLSKTLVLVVSKTGTTLETATNENFARQHFQKAGLDPAKHFVSISMPNSPMDNPKLYLACFHIWDWIGGRYSTTSMVGGVLLSFVFGWDVYWEFLRGANAMDKAALSTDVHNNLPLISALLGIWNRNFLHYPTLAIIPYSQALWRYPAHIQQLDMESHGKRIDQQGIPVEFDTGPIIWGEAGTNAQHSFYQLIHQGTTVVPLELIGFKMSQQQQDILWEGTTSQQKLLANLLAQSLALATGESNDNPNKVFPGNRPTHILIGNQLTPYNLGVLLAFFEHKIAFQGFIWDINSFDQEGVQLGKVLANKILQRFSGQSKPYPLADTLIEQVESIK